MKKLNVILIIAIILILCNIGEVLAADVSDTMTVHMSVEEIAIVNINPGNEVSLTITAPDTAGDVPADIVNDLNYLQYTSTVSESATKKITAQLSGAILVGCSLKLESTVGSGSNEGTSAGQVTLSSESASDIITGIGTCATGTSSTNGAKLTYTLTVDDISSLIAGEDKYRTVTFTLTDNN